VCAICIALRAPRALAGRARGDGASAWRQVLVEMDEVEINSQAFTEEACRKRWSLLDMVEFERRQGIARELMTMRDVMETRMSYPSTPQTGARHFGEAAKSPPSTAGPALSARSPSAASSPSLVPDAQRVGASLAPSTQRMPAAQAQQQQQSATQARAAPGEASVARAADPPERVALAGRAASMQRSAPPAAQGSSPCLATNQAQPAGERKEAWTASSARVVDSASASARATRSESNVAGDSEDDDTDDSEEIEVVDASELRQRGHAAVLAATARPATASVSESAAGGGGAGETGRDAVRPGPVMSKAEFEQSVESEKLERSDFTIFTHDLKKTCDGFYNTVKANLPSIQVEEVTDDDDDDVTPVFSNLKVNEKGEYVGTLHVGPLLADEAPVAAAAADKPMPAAVATPADAARAAHAPISIEAPSVEVAEASSSDDEVEEVVDASELRRRAMGMAHGPNASQPRSSPPPASAAPVQGEQERQESLGKISEKDLRVLRKAEADLKSAMQAQARDSAPPPVKARTAQETAELDAKLAAAVKNSPALNVEFEAIKGMACADKGDHAQALQHLSAAIEGAGIMPPKDGSAEPAQKTQVSMEDAVKWLVLRGKSYRELQQCYNAVPDLAKAVSLDEGSVEARLQYAMALRFSCQYVEAAEQIKHVLRLDPDNMYGKLEERRLQQRIAHAQGQDLDTWRRKDSVISTAKQIQARAEHSIKESRSKIESLSHRQKEKELEQAFFEQIRDAKDRQATELRKQAAASGDAILDINLGGVDVDSLLQELQDLEPDPNVFRTLSPRAPTEEKRKHDEDDENEGGPSLPPLLQALVGMGPPVGTPLPPATPASAPACEVPVQDKTEPAAVEELPPPTAREIATGVRAPRSNIAGLFEPTAQAPTPALISASPAGAAALPDQVPSRAQAPKKEEASAPVSKGSIGAKLRALREGQIPAPMPPVAAAPPSTDYPAGSQADTKPHEPVAQRATTATSRDYEQLFGTSVGHDVVAPTVPLTAAAQGYGTAAAQGYDALFGGSVTERRGQLDTPAAAAAAAPTAAVPKAEVDTPTASAERKGSAQEELVPSKKPPTAAERREMAMQQRARGRMQMVGSDEEDDDSEEEQQDLMALRSKLKERSKKLSPEEQQEEERKRAARQYLDDRAEEFRKEQERRAEEEAERKKAEEERQKQLDKIAAESARRRREMDEERERKERLEREEKAALEKQRREAEDAALEEEEEAMLQGKAELAAARARPPAAGSPGGAAAGSPVGTGGRRAKTAEEEFEIEVDEDAAEEAMMQQRHKEAQRHRDERVAAAALRHKKMLELSKGPMASLPGALFFELSQRAALEDVPAAVDDHCVLLIPDMEPALVADILQWLLTPASLATALEMGTPAEREAYGLSASSARVGGGLPEFAFQVVGLSRAALSQDLCMSSLLPPATQKHQAQSGAPEPVFMVALTASAVPTSDLAGAVKLALDSVRLADLCKGAQGASPAQDAYLNVPMTASLKSVVSVISGKSAVSPTIKSPLFWFMCAPAVAGGGDVSGPVNGSPDDSVCTVLRPEAVANGAIGHILARLADENMDLTSLRMLYPSQEHYARSRAFTSAVVSGGCPLIVIASRGFKAVDRWSEAVGPEDPFVAKRTDPTSLRAKYGSDRKKNLLTCSRSVERNRREVEWYFSLAHDIEVDESTSAALLPSIPMILPYAVTSTTLVVRAGAPGSFIAQVMSFCLRNGFTLSAFRRSKLEPSAGQHVGLPVWISIKGVSPPPVILQLTAEHAVARLLRLGPALGQMAEESGVATLFEEECTLTPPPRQPAYRASPGASKAVFETYANVVAVARTLEGAQRCGVHLDLNQGPECIDRVSFSSRLADKPSRFVATKEVPQAVCVVVTPDAVTDAAAMSEIFEALFVKTGAELLGAKLLTWLPEHVSAEMCPFPKDHHMRDDFLEHVESGPVFVIAMRMVDGLERVQKIVGPLPGTGALALLGGARTGPASPGQTLRAKFAVDGVRCAVVRTCCLC